MEETTIQNHPKSQEKRSLEHKQKYIRLFRERHSLSIANKA